MSNIGKVIAIRKNKEIYKCDNKVIKLFYNNHSVSDVLNEALNQTRVAENSNLNIPKLLEVTRYDDRWAIVSENVEGKTISQLIKENPENTKTYIDLFINIQLLILENNVPMLNRIKDKFRLKLKKATNIDDNLRYELLQRLEGMDEGEYLCHGDYYPSNVIVSNDIIYIIDWAHVTLGNAAADAARTYLLFSMHNHNDIADYYLDNFSEQSNISKKEIQRWIPIVAATQYTKNNKDELEFLSKWMNVVDFE